MPPPAQTQPSSAKSRLPRPVLYIVLFFDPRRWVGAVLAIGGVIISIVTPFLPPSVAARILYADKKIVPSRSRSLPKPIQQNKVILTSNDRGFSGSSAATSSSPPRSDSFQSGTPSLLVSSQEHRPCLDSLDLASPNAVLVLVDETSRRQSRVKIAFRKKRASLGVHGDEVQLDVELANDLHHGSVMQRCNTSPTPSGVSTRRKFSLFNRDRSRTAASDTEHPCHRLSPSAGLLTLPQSLEVGPSTSTLSHPPALIVLNSSKEEIPLSRTATPPVRHQRTDPYKKFGVPVPGSEQAKAFVKAEKLWLKAEKEKREKDRVLREAEVEREKEKEKAEQKENRKENGKRNSMGSKWKRFSKGKEKDASPHTPVTPPAPINTPSTTQSIFDHHHDPGVEADADGEDEGHSQSHEGALTDEFGALFQRDTNVTMLVPPPKSKWDKKRPQSSSAATGTKRWMFARRTSTDGRGACVSEREEVKEKREKGMKLRFISSGKGRGKLKGTTERGYASETGVSSVAYKLL